MKTLSAVALDDTDRKMIRALQADGRMTNADLARTVNLSESACLRRLRALEAAEVISRYAAIINERAVGLPISVFVTVTLSSQAEASLTAFETAIGRQAALWLAAQDPAAGAVGFDTLGRFERDGRDRHAGGPSVGGLLDLSWDAFWKELA